MKKIVAIGVLLVSLVGLSPVSAQAGGATNAALGLGAFAVFNQIIGGVGIFGPRWAYPAPGYYPTPYDYPYYYYPYYYPRYYDPAPVYAAPAVTYYSAPVATYAPSPAPAQSEVVYPHGKYVLTGDGVRVAYQWVWVPNPPAGPPPPSPAGGK